MRFATVVPLALAGLVAAWPLRRRLAILYLFVGSYLATVLLFFVTARYRLPAVPILCVFAGYGAVAILRWIKRSSQPAEGATARPVFLLGGLAVGVGLVSLPLYEPRDFYANQYASIGSVLQGTGAFCGSGRALPQSGRTRSNRGAVSEQPRRVSARPGKGPRKGNSGCALGPGSRCGLRPGAAQSGKIAEERGNGPRALELYGRRFRYPIPHSPKPASTSAGCLRRPAGSRSRRAGYCEMSCGVIRRIGRRCGTWRSCWGRAWNVRKMRGRSSIACSASTRDTSGPGSSVPTWRHSSVSVRVFREPGRSLSRRAVLFQRTGQPRCRSKIDSTWLVCGKRSMIRRKPG